MTNAKTKAWKKHQRENPLRNNYVEWRRGWDAAMKEAIEIVNEEQMRESDEYTAAQRMVKRLGVGV